MTTDAKSGSRISRDSSASDAPLYNERLWIAWHWIIAGCTIAALAAAILVA